MLLQHAQFLPNAWLQLTFSRQPFGYQLLLHDSILSLLTFIQLLSDKAAKVISTNYVEHYSSVQSHQLGMWRSSNLNAIKFRIILPHSTFVECWTCLVIECEFDSVDVRSTDLSHCNLRETWTMSILNMIHNFIVFKFQFCIRIDNCLKWY